MDRAYRRFPSPLGPLLGVSSGGKLLSLDFDPAEPPEEDLRDPVLAETGAWLAAYFAGDRPDPTGIPLAPQGTLFQKTVWDLLGEIPYGQSVTYGALAVQAAERLGRRRMAAQAVGQAVGRNPIVILLPCHRVLGAGGRLTGYAGGLDRKIFLLEREGIPFRREEWLSPTPR